VIHCEICKQTINDGVTLWRVNEFGVKGVWRCAKCLSPQQLAVRDPEAVRITNIIESNGEKE
jgi:hypothetical protein